jgi:hypothetical protein
MCAGETFFGGAWQPAERQVTGLAVGEVNVQDVFGLHLSLLLLKRCNWFLDWLIFAAMRLVLSESFAWPGPPMGTTFHISNETLLGEDM